MCGIHAVISTTAPAPLPPTVRETLSSRGPDHFGQHAARLRAPSQLVGEGETAAGEPGGLFLTFTSTVLALRGDRVTAQPFVHPETGSVLCWNGEAWKMDGSVVPGNDGELVFRRLSEASARVQATPQTGEMEDAAASAILGVLRSIQGPFAFVYLDAAAQTVYYGRDRLGRRSLLIRRDVAHGGTAAVSSVTMASAADTCDSSWVEVEADGVYVIRLRAESSHGFAPATRLEWSDKNEEDLVLSIGRFNMDLPGQTCSPLLPSSASVGMLKEQLIGALRLRILNIPRRPETTAGSSDTRVAILFSGGLDCTVLARLCHDLLPPDQAIDVLNVAFENPRVAGHLRQQADGRNADIYEACPDRVTGRKALLELKTVCPGRHFRFVSINVPYAETVAHRQRVISLMHPHNTEMDLSIAYALYFASRGRGTCSSLDPCPPFSPSLSSSSSPSSSSYRTPARVLLSGLGADELFGGYTRHAAAFARRGYAGLAAELRLDTARLGRRNLGRDDRVLAHWGREVRFPYLDEELVRWAMGVPVWEKCDFGNGDGDSAAGVGVEAGKRILRLLALELGMSQVAREKKRAIQFGARTAKMESGRVKGTALVS